MESHDHSHSHSSVSRKRLMWALIVTGVFLLTEVVGAIVTGSLALAADAGHMAVDSSGLLVALIAAQLMLRPRNDNHTWGWARAEVVAAALQAGMLIIISVLVAWQAISRLITPEEIEAQGMLLIGIAGLIANIVALLILSGGRKSSLNMRAAFLEVMNDALGSVAVIVAAAAAMFTDWSGTDAVASLIIAALMVPRSLILLRSAVRILMEQTPEEINLVEVREHMEALPGVVAVHDLHVSTIQTGLHALTAHVSVGDITRSEQSALLHSLEECAQQHFPLSIGHTTFQIEPEEHRDHEHMIH